MSNKRCATRDCRDVLLSRVFQYIPIQSTTEFPKHEFMPATDHIELIKKAALILVSGVYCKRSSHIFFHRCPCIKMKIKIQNIHFLSPYCLSFLHQPIVLSEFHYLLIFRFVSICSVISVCVAAAIFAIFKRTILL